MTQSVIGAGECFAGREAVARELPAMLDVRGVARFLGCSARHIYRLSDAGKMPRPVKLGHLCRWSRAAIEGWIAQGCPSCRQAGSTR